LDKYLLETRDKNLFSEKAVNMKRDLQEVLKSTKSVEKQL
jgi:hypothetical protein